jgi:hypothetical protein
VTALSKPPGLKNKFVQFISRLTTEQQPAKKEELLQPSIIIISIRKKKARQDNEQTSPKVKAHLRTPPLSAGKESHQPSTSTALNSITSRTTTRCCFLLKLAAE